MTVLFEKDFKNEDGQYIAKPDTKTTNTSFKKMAALLKLLNVKNHLFMLSLYDQRLVGIDPHKLNSVNDPYFFYRGLVVRECKRNFWYFVREVARAPSQGGAPVPIELNRANMAFIWLFNNNIDSYLIIPRQTGKSLMSCLIWDWILYIRGFNMEIGLLVHRAKAKTENVERVKILRDVLPPYLINVSKTDIDNKEGLGYKALANKYLSEVGSKEVEQAMRIYRGGTLTNLHIEEFAFIPNIDKTYPSIMAATIRAKENAKLNGQPYANMITTTAGDPNTESGQYALATLNKTMLFSEKLYDCKDLDELLLIIQKNTVGKHPMVSCIYSFLQLGKTHEWFDETVSRVNGTPDDIARDYRNEWVSKADNPVLSPEMISKIKQYENNTPYVEFIDGYKFSWYTPPNINKNYYKEISLIMGMDASEMSGRDFTTFVVIDPRDLSVVFTFRCNEANIAKLSVTISNILLAYPKMVFAPERKNSGVVIIDIVSTILIKNGQNPFKRIFNYVVDNIHTDTYKGIDINQSELAEVKYKKTLGFMTTGRSRDILYSEILISATSLAYNKINDTILISELSGLQYINNRVDHSEGNHDDMVIAWLIACYVVLYGKNLIYYGIKPEDVISKVTNGNSETITINPTVYNQQLKIEQKLRVLQEILQKTTIPEVRTLLLDDIRELERNIIPGIVSKDPITIDNIRRDYDDYNSDLKDHSSSIRVVDAETTRDMIRLHF